MTSAVCPICDQTYTPKDGAVHSNHSDRCGGAWCKVHPGYNYKPNQVAWKVGDLVIHDKDHKVQKMLMKIVRAGVIGWDKHKQPIHAYGCQYIIKAGKHLSTMRHVWNNHQGVLHDPARFNIEVPKL